MFRYKLTSGNAKVILVWPVFCFLIGVVLWLFIGWKLESEQVSLQERALNDASSLSRVYATFLGRSFEQMDQITMHVRLDWEHLQGKFKLEDLKRDGLFASAQFEVVAIIDRNGHPVSSTMTVDTNTSVATQDYFLFHKSNNSTALRIGTPTISSFTGRSVIYFTRRLETRDEMFDGIVLIGVDPAYLLSFYDSSILGKQGLLAVIGEDGFLRSSTIGGANYSASSAALQVPDAFRSVQPTRLVQGDGVFQDKLSRYVGWQDVKTYPFIVLVGLSKKELFSPYEGAWSTYRSFEIGGTIFLIVFALAGGIFGIRLAERERQALAVRKTYRVATDGANEGFYILSPVFDDDNRIVDWQLADCNERGAIFFGIPHNEFLGLRLTDIYPNQLFDSVMDVFNVAYVAGIYEDEYRVPAGSPMNVNWVYRRIVKSETGLALTLRDISEAKKSEQNLVRLANEDALTSLPNRHWLMRFLPIAMERTLQSGNMLAILFVDLDEFKNVNDTLGHSVGDELLKIVAMRVKAVLRPNDKMVRLGGDEFTIVVEQVMHKHDAALVAERVTKALKAPIELSTGKQFIGASIGISIFPEDGGDPEILLKNADIAMYSVKANGKGHHRFFESHLYERLRGRLDSEQALRHAIDLDQFVLHYQPRVNTRTCKICGMEALVRWVHPERGLIPPLEFIPLAESTGLILKLGELVIAKACAQIAAWKNAGLPTFPVSVNVSPRQFSEGNIKALLSLYIARHGIDADDIQVEITESAMMGEQDEIVQELAEMRMLGIKLLVDDFGTGYSSLSQLQRLDMDVLKVDRAFTMELGATKEGEVFFKAIVSMAHALGMKVTAEGVETIEQLQILRTLECDEVQGYLISRPVSAKDMEAMLENGLTTATRPMLLNVI
jgi:diguanylate cyclase (GGDEF)-like protein